MALPTVPTEATRRRIRLAQDAYRLAERLARARPAPADRVGAVVQLDFCAETLLRAVHTDLVPGAPPWDFKSLLKGAVGAVEMSSPGATAPARGHLERVHDIRNSAQHHARVPTADEVQECRVHVRDVAAALVAVVWGVDFNRLDVDLVRDGPSREDLQQAAAARASGDLSGAMGWTAGALNTALARATEALVGSHVRIERVLVADRTRTRTTPDSDDQLPRTVRNLQTLVAIGALGLDLPEYAGFRELTDGAPAVNINGQLVPYAEGPGRWTPEDLDEALRYVVDSIVRIEDLVGDLDRPFGHPRWGRPVPFI